MIDVIFQLGNEIVFVRIDKGNVLFSTGTHKEYLEPIDSLKLDYGGVIKEFPDLKDNKQWRSEAIQRFKHHIKSLNSEDKIFDYIKNDLAKYGYVPIKKMKAGHRPEAIKD